MTNKNSKQPRKLVFLLLLITIWLVSCILQYIFCCRSNNEISAEQFKVTTSNTSDNQLEVKTTTNKTSAQIINTDNIVQNQKAEINNIAANSVIKELLPNKESSVVLSHLPFHLTAKDLNLTGKDNFVFANNDYIAQQPITKSLSDNLVKTVAYLDDNPFYQLTVTGRYHPNEINHSIFPDLGIARASHIRDYLVFLGANSHQLIIDSKPYPEAVSDTDQNYLGMANFSLQELKNSALTNKSLIIQQLSDEIRANPLLLYFQTGTSNINLTDSQRQRLLTISQYLSYSPEAKAIITGHTDSTGNREKNIQLGQGRAEFAANYLEKNGLHRNQMIINSKGPDMPIADNKTPEGRSKNRRVVITVTEPN